ncbi:MAG: ATP-binding protein [Caulobacterales bacterium]
MRANEHEAGDAGVGSRGIWLGVGGPILGLMLVIIAGFLTMSWNVAYRQDRNWVKDTQKLVDSALDGRSRALSNTVMDFAFWNDAYQAISVRWDQRWITRNYYSAIADGLVVFRKDEPARYSWFSELHSQSAEDAAAIAVRSASVSLPPVLLSQADEKNMLRTGLSVVAGKVILVAMAPVSLESEDQRRANVNRHPTDYVVAVDFLDPSELMQIGRDLGVDGLAFRSGLLSDRESAELVWSPLYDRSGNLLGGLTWRNVRPGMHEFAIVAWPIAIGLLFAGLLAIFVTRHLVKRQLQVMAQAASVVETGRLKAQFVATMSHELRTPLNAIIGYSELIHEVLETDSPRDKEARADTGKISDAARHLLRLINEILDLARIDAGFMPVLIDQVDVSHALTEILDVVEPMALARGNAIRVKVAEENLTVLADAARLSQCLLNLANNAVKFTKNGAIEINAGRTYKGKREFVVFEVKDTGIGIERGALARLFTPFSQVDDTATRAHEGAGLGLSITRRLARAMGGDVTAVSEPGKGSTFTLSLPAAAVALERAA